MYIQEFEEINVDNISADINAMMEQVYTEANLNANPIYEDAMFLSEGKLSEFGEKAKAAFVKVVEYFKKVLDKIIKMMTKRGRTVLKVTKQFDKYRAGVMATSKGAINVDDDSAKMAIDKFLSAETKALESINKAATSHNDAIKSIGGSDANDLLYTPTNMKFSETDRASQKIMSVLQRIAKALNTVTWFTTKQSKEYKDIKTFIAMLGSHAQRVAQIAMTGVTAMNGLMAMQLPNVVPDERRLA